MFDSCRVESDFCWNLSVGFTHGNDTVPLRGTGIMVWGGVRPVGFTHG